MANMLDKLLFKTFGVKNFLVDYFPLLDINKDSIVMENNSSLYLYKRRNKE